MIHRAVNIVLLLIVLPLALPCGPFYNDAHYGWLSGSRPILWPRTPRCCVLWRANDRQDGEVNGTFRYR
jgi:hypothetical protein